MASHIAVVDPLPMFRQGVAAALTSAGFIVDTPDDLVTWLGQFRGNLVLLTLEAEKDWRLLTQLAFGPSGQPVIALIADTATATGVQAIRAGARSVLHRDASGEAMRRTVEATIAGQAVVPAAVLTALAPPVVDRAVAAVTIGPDKVAWLRALARGVTVARLAERVGYSERAIFRLLNALYKELGVTTRTEALIVAMERGWLRASGS